MKDFSPQKQRGPSFCHYFCFRNEPLLYSLIVYLYYIPFIQGNKEYGID